MTSRSGPPPIDFTQPLTIDRLLRRAIEWDAEHPALVAPSARLDYGQLDAAVRRYAARLVDRGVGPGSRVVVALPNDAAIVCVFLATWRLGAVYIGIPRSTPPAERARLVLDCAADLLVCDPSTAASTTDVACPMWVLDRGFDLPGGVAAAALPELAVEFDPFDLGAVNFTSGTTGRPKGVMHSQHGAITPAAVSVHIGALRWDEPILAVNPLTTLNTMITNIVVAIAACSTCVIIDRHDPRSIAAAVAREGIVCLSTVPTIYYDLLSDPEITPEQLRSLRKPRVGGAAMSAALKERFAARFGRWPAASYALSEAPTWVSRQEADSAVSAHPGGCGTPLPHLEVVIVGADGRPVGPGEPGEIGFRARTEGEWAGVFRPMLGYLNVPGSAPPGGLVMSGDIGMLTPDGELVLLERRSQLIIRGGSNVYPSEVENVLVDDPAVREACVIPRPDERLGELVVAVVEPVPGREIDVDRLLDRCREVLASYKVPSEVVVVSELPRTPLGKVQRSAVPTLLEF